MSGLGCKGICHRYRSNKVPNKLRYIDGEVLCRIYKMFMRNGGIILFCPCCNFRVRSGPRTAKSKSLRPEHVMVV